MDKVDLLEEEKRKERVISGNIWPCGSEASQGSGGPSKTGASCCSGNILVLGWERPSRGHTVHLSNRNTHWLISTCMAIQAPFNTVKTGTLMECYNTSSLYKKESVSHLGDCSAERGSGPHRPTYRLLRIGPGCLAARALWGTGSVLSTSASTCLYGCTKLAVYIRP